MMTKELIEDAKAAGLLDSDGYIKPLWYDPWLEAIAKLVELQRQRERQAVPSWYLYEEISGNKGYFIGPLHDNTKWQVDHNDLKLTPFWFAAPSPELITPKLHAASYEHNGKQYAITLEGCHEEVHAHAMRLGFTVDGVIVHQEVITDAAMQEKRL